MSLSSRIGSGSGTWRQLFSRPLLAAVLACLLAAAGAAVYLTHRDVTARMERNFAAGKYREATIDLQTLVRRQPANVDFRTKLAESLLRTGNFRDAETQFGKARQLGAAAAPTLPGLTEALLGEGRYQDAIDGLNRERAASGEGTALLKLRGRALLGLNRDSEAREVWLEAISKGPQDPAAHLGLAQTLLALGDKVAAKAELDKATAVGQDDLNVHIARGRWVLESQPAEARAEFTKALELAQRSSNRADKIGTLALLGEADLAVPDLAAAGQHLQQLQNLAPKAEATLLLQARIALQTDHLSEAQATLKEVLSRDPHSEPANVMLAFIAGRNGQPAAAEAYLAEALSVQPGNLKVRQLLAEAQLAQREAERALRTAVDPQAAGDPALLSLAGRASLLEGDVAGGVTYFERSERAAPADKSRSLQVAAAYLAAHRNADALALLRKLEVPDTLVDRREWLLLSALADAGRAPEARAEAQRFAEARPQDPAALLIAAGSLQASQDAPAARALLSRASALDPKSPQPWVQLGWLEWSQRDTAAAERAFGRALELAPQSNPALLGAAQTDLVHGNSAAAIGKLELVRARAPRALPPRVGLAQIYLAAGNLQKATDALDEARTLEPENPDVRQVGGLLALARGNGPEAVTAFEGLAKQFPKVPQLRADLARAYLLTGHLAEAQASATAALGLDPAYWPALVTQITVSLRQNDPRGADAALERLRHTKAPEAEVLSVTGDLDASAGRLDGALKAFAAANTLRPSASLALRMFVVRRARHDSDADAPLRDWLQRSPTDVTVRVVLAEYLQVKGESSPAAQEYETVLKQAPQQPIALNNLAWIRLESGDAQGGLDLAHRAYVNNHGLPAVADTYGWALVQTGHAEDAVPLLRGAYDKMPTDNEVRYHLGVALVKSGALAEGRVQLKAVAASQDKSAAAERARAFLANLDAGGKG